MYISIYKCILYLYILTKIQYQFWSSSFLSSIISRFVFVVCIGENAALVSAGGGDNMPSPITYAVGASGDPIVTPNPVLESIMRVLGVSSGGSHAAAHIDPFESNLTSLSLTSGRCIEVVGVGGVDGGGAPSCITGIGAACASSASSELSLVLSLVASSGNWPASMPACSSIVASTTSAGTLTYSVGRRPAIVLAPSAYGRSISSSRFGYPTSTWVYGPASWRGIQW